MILTPTSPKPSRPCAATGFTLIEMLTGIAIIGVLAAILIPSLGKLQNSAATRKTISNLMQLQAANTLYAADHNGRYVPAQVNGDWDKMWFQNEAFLGYLGVRKTDRMWDEDWPEVAKSGLRTANPNQPPGKIDRQASIGINLGNRQHWKNADGSFNDLSFKQSAIRKPSKAMAFADSTDVWIRMDRAERWVSDQEAARKGWFNMAIAYRNNGRAAVVFYDGHVELLEPKQVKNNWELWVPDSSN